MATNTAIFDGNYLLHRCCHVGQLSDLKNRHGKPTGGLLGALNSIQGTLTQFRVQKCIIVFDSGISERRRQLYPTYKGSRHRDRTDPLYEELTDEHKQYNDSFRRQLTYLKYVLSFLNVQSVKIPNTEADDIVYKIAIKHCQTGIIYIVSDDRDYLQMVDQWQIKVTDNQPRNCQIQIIRPIAKELITSQNFELMVGYPQTQFLLRKAIEGDSSDNITGVNGIGPKWLDKIFAEYSGPVDYPFEDFFSFCMSHKTKTVRKISDQKKTVLMNYELISLADEPYTTEIHNEIRNQLDKKTMFDIHKVKTFLVELDMFSLVKKLHQWVIPFQRLR